MKKLSIYVAVFFVTYLIVYFSYGKYIDSIKLEYQYNTVGMKKEKKTTLNTKEKESATDTYTNTKEFAPTPTVTEWIEPHDPVRASSSSDNYLVEVVKSEQKVYVYKNDELFKKMDCSTGLEEDGYITPIGTYYVNSSYGESFYNQKYKSGAKYWVGFIDSVYLFHSVPIDENGDIIENEAKKLGSQASHGCVRLSEEEAFWFYETIPIGSKVIIRE